MSMFSSASESWFNTLAPYIQAIAATTDERTRARYVGLLENKWHDLSRCRTEEWVFGRSRVAGPCRVLQNPQIVHTGLTVDGDYIVIDFDTRMVGTIEEILNYRRQAPRMSDWSSVVDLSAMIDLIRARGGIDASSRSCITPRPTNPLDGPTDQQSAASPTDHYPSALSEISRIWTNEYGGMINVEASSAQERAGYIRGDGFSHIVYDDLETVARVDEPIVFTRRSPIPPSAPAKPVTPKKRSMKFRLDFYFSRQAHNELLEKLTASNKFYQTQTIPIEGTKATWIKVSWNEE